MKVLKISGIPTAAHDIENETVDAAQNGEAIFSAHTEQREVERFHKPVAQRGHIRDGKIGVIESDYDRCALGRRDRRKPECGALLVENKPYTSRTVTLRPDPPDTSTELPGRGFSDTLMRWENSAPAKLPGDRSN